MINSYLTLSETLFSEHVVQHMEKISKNLQISKRFSDVLRWDVYVGKPAGAI